MMKYDASPTERKQLPLVDQIRWIGSDAVRPGQLVSDAWSALFECLTLIGERLDAIEQKTKVGSDFAKNLGKEMESRRTE